VADLIAAIQRFVDAWNDRCAPFTWTKDPDTVIAKATDPRHRKTPTDVRYGALEAYDVADLAFEFEFEDGGEREGLRPPALEAEAARAGCRSGGSRRHARCACRCTRTRTL
jgi:hypothetical protein